MSPTSEAEHRPHPAAVAIRVARRALLAGALLLETLALESLAVAPFPAPVSAASRASAPATRVTSTTIASLNLLGAAHTDGQRSPYARSRKRLRWSMEALEQEKVKIVGFQEMQPSQVRAFLARHRKSWALFPGHWLSDRAGHNSIAWRKSRWQAVHTRTIDLPYFYGNPFPMPYVMLRHRVTGQRLWILNVHNPSDAYGPAKRWRNKAVRKEIRLVNRLRSRYPRVPVFLTGDMNAHRLFFCPMVRNTALFSASGGSVRRSRCHPPEAMKVDWLLSTRRLVRFTDYRVRRDRLVAKATDHPLIIARATVRARTR